MNEPILHTPRLILKGISAQTIQELFRIKSEAEIRSFFNVDDAGFERLKEMQEQGLSMYRVSNFSFLLIEKESGLPVGECGFHTWNTFHCRAEIFYAMRSDTHMGKGYMKEALPEVIRYGFEQMILNRIQALVSKDNTPSRKLIQSAGFTFEGTLRGDYRVGNSFENSECYSLLREEWAQL